MDIGGIFNKLDNPMLGQIIGFFATENAYKEGNPIGVLQVQIEYLMKQPHIPSFESVLGDLTSGPASAAFKSLIMLGLGGWFMKEIDLHPTVGRIGKIAQTIGFSGAIGSVLAVILDHSGRQYSSGQSSGGGGGGSSRAYGY